MAQCTVQRVAVSRLNLAVCAGFAGVHAPPPPFAQSHSPALAVPQTGAWQRCTPFAVVCGVHSFAWFTLQVSALVTGKALHLPPPPPHHLLISAMPCPSHTTQRDRIVFEFSAKWMVPPEQQRVLLLSALLAAFGSWTIAIVVVCTIFMCCGVRVADGGRCCSGVRAVQTLRKSGAPLGDHCHPHEASRKEQKRPRSLWQPQRKA